jgi:hypothetical protein
MSNRGTPSGFPGPLRPDPSGAFGYLSPPDPPPGVKRPRS